MDRSWDELLRLIPAIPGYLLTSAQALYYGTKLIKSWSRRKPPDPAAKVERRLRLREEFEQHLSGRRTNHETYGEVMIRDVRRVDSYPDLDDEKGTGPSSWFKMELGGLYHRGIEVISWPRQYAIPVEGSGDTWRFLDEEEAEATARKVLAYPVGRIPFDFIEKVDWDGDEYDNIPHIYCRYDGPYAEPYEALIFKGRIYDSERLFELRGLRRDWEAWRWPRRLVERLKLWVGTRRPKRASGKAP